MRARCSPPEAPWITIKADDKEKARLAAFDAILETVGRDVDVEPPEASVMVKAFFDTR